MWNHFGLTVLCLLMRWPVAMSKYEQSIVVMTFNTWNSGANVEDGLFKIAKHILYNEPDIVALQEIMATGFLNVILRHLGPGWTGVAANDSYPDLAILTRHEIVSSSDWIADGHQSSAGYMWAQIRIPHWSYPFDVHFWNIHLDWRDYGPYAACNKLVTAAEQIDAGEWGKGRMDFGRAQQVSLLIKSKAFVEHLSKTDEVPLILAGDFNSPSHLDWTAPTKSKHCDWEYAWPATYQLTNVGLKDSFREYHPNASEPAGHTWSTVRKGMDGWNGTIPEPQDRIDMIFYNSSLWKLMWVTTYHGIHNPTPYPDHYSNDWPSDHFSVVAKFSNYEFPVDKIKYF